MAAINAKQQLSVFIDAFRKILTSKKIKSPFVVGEFVFLVRRFSSEEQLV